MAAIKAVRKRRTKRGAVPALGKTTWAIVGPDGATIRENSYGAGAVLALAQTLASLADKPWELTVERRDLFGAPAQLYRVVRNEDGNVDTEIISQED